MKGLAVSITSETGLKAILAGNTARLAPFLSAVPKKAISATVKIKSA